jgi:hydrogenase maturation factor
VVPPEFYGMSSEGWTKELTIKVIFEEVEKGKMIMTLVHIGFNKKSAEMAAESWNQSFDKLAASLQQER